MKSFFMSLATLMLVAHAHAVEAQNGDAPCCVIKVSGPTQICRYENPTHPLATYTATTRPAASAPCTYTWIVTNGVTFTTAGNSIFSIQGATSEGHLLRF